MRNTTKLKHILLKYDILLTMPDDSFFRMALIDKSTNEEKYLEGKNYSEVISKAYSTLLRSLD